MKYTSPSFTSNSRISKKSNTNKLFLLILFGLIIAIIGVSFLIYKNKKSKYNLMPINIEKVYELELQSRKIYPKVKLNNLFKKYPKKVKNLRFGYICPGAMKTIDYLNKKVTNDKQKNIANNIRILTDFQFFVEIYQIYKEYLDDSIKLEMMKIIKNNGCKISKSITQEITRLFGTLPKNIRENLPDDFYHIRHDTLICSKSKTLAKDRIDLLKSIYGSVENFNNGRFGKCLGTRNGKSGCRDCCRTHFSNNYRNCVSACMDF